jgi:hypothetical protein
MTNPLSTLEGDLTTLAAPDGADPDTKPAQPTPALTAAQEVLSLLADQTLVGSSIGGAVSGVYTTIASAITDDVVDALQKIATELTSTLAGLDISDAVSALTALQNALQTAQSLVPGGSSAVASAFASTTQFATLFGNLLQVPGTTVGDAAKTLNTIAQQLVAIAAAFTAAAAGNP